MTPPSGAHAKSLGAFYTDGVVAEFLVRWVVRSRGDTVLDPSFGGGVFLRAAYERVHKLGGKPKAQIYGVEIDPQVHAHLLNRTTHLSPKRLICSDFFEVEPSSFPKVQAVVGNPPFIRYQRFSGEAREKALARAAAQGVQLNRLSASWAPFLVHSVAMLAEGGRLGMVIPAELVHAAYARPLLAYLARSFAQVTLITFRKKLFAGLSQDTLLLLAEGRGERTDRLGWLDLQDANKLEGLSSSALKQCRKLNAYTLASGSERLIEWIIPEPTRKLYRQLKASPQIQKLGQLAEVGIGYVSGANDFFHLSPEQVKASGIPERFLQPAVWRGRSLIGLQLTEQDWQAATDSRDAGYLFFINGQTRLPKSVIRYIEQGEAEQVHQAYKCRVRSPWYSVPSVVKPNAFLSYMSTEAPRLVANSAGVVASNTLHGVRLCSEKLSAEGLACLWQTSLTRLSAELEGHSMGGGMLKLEPTEASQILIAMPKLTHKKMAQLSTRLNQLIRKGQAKAAQTLADQIILQQGLGLSELDCQRLAEAAEQLRERRCSR